jgi:hypothetical protein
MQILGGQGQFGGLWPVHPPSEWLAFHLHSRWLSGIHLPPGISVGQLPDSHLLFRVPASLCLNLNRGRNRIHLHLRPISKSPARSGSLLAWQESNPVIQRSARRQQERATPNDPIDPIDPKSHKYPRRRPRHHLSSPLQPALFVYSSCPPSPGSCGSPIVD